MDDALLKKALGLALELAKQQHFEILGLKNSVFALRESMRAVIPESSYNEVLRRTVIDRAQAGGDDPELVRLLDQLIQKVRIP